MDYTTSFEREAAEDPRMHRTLTLTPWTVQGITYELIVNHFVTNKPEDFGYNFAQRYDKNFDKSDIFISIANDWDAKQPSKRPAIFIDRGAASIQNPVLNQRVAVNPQESEVQKLSIITLPIRVSVIATKVGLAEQLSEFTRIPFRYFQEQIRCDFGFARYRLEAVHPPQITKDNRDNFIVILEIGTVFYDNFIIKGDDLKVKTISKTIFDEWTQKPFTNQ